MQSKFPSLSKVVPSSALFVSLYILEVSALVIAMAVHKKGERLLLAFMATPAGVIAIVAVALLVISICVILLQLRNSPYPWTQWLAAHLVLNLCSVVLVLATTEVVIRLYTVDGIEAPMFANTTLLVAAYRGILQ